MGRAGFRSPGILHLRDLVSFRKSGELLSFEYPESPHTTDSHIRRCYQSCLQRDGDRLIMAPKPASLHDTSGRTRPVRRVESTKQNASSKQVLNPVRNVSKSIESVSFLRNAPIGHEGLQLTGLWLSLRTTMLASSAFIVFNQVSLEPSFTEPNATQPPPEGNDSYLPTDLHNDVMQTVVTSSNDAVGILFRAAGQRRLRWIRRGHPRPATPSPQWQRILHQPKQHALTCHDYYWPDFR